MAINQPFRFGKVIYHNDIKKAPALFMQALI